MAPGGDSAVMAKGLTVSALSGQQYCSRRSSSSASATAIDGSGPPRSRAARRRAATNRSSESMISMSRMGGA